MTAGPAPQHQRVQSLLAAHRYEDAESLVGQMVATSPEEPVFRCLLAQARLGRDRNTDALRAADSALRLAPDEEWAHRLRSVALHRLGRHRKALVEALEAVRLAPTTPACFQVLCDAQLGALRLRDAERTAAHLVSLAPEDPASHSTAGRVALASKDLRFAETCFRRALELAPDSTEALNNLGVTLQRAGQQVEAIRIFEAAARTNPRSQPARQNLLGAASQHAGIGGMVPVLLALPAALVIPLELAARVGAGLGTLVMVAVLVVVLCGLCALYLFLRGRRAELSATVRAFQEAELRRWWVRPLSWGRRTFGRRER